MGASCVGPVARWISGSVKCCLRESVGMLKAQLGVRVWGQFRS